MLVRRYQPVLDFIRANPRYILEHRQRSLDGEAPAMRRWRRTSPTNSRRAAWHAGDAGVLLLGAHHAAAVSDSKKSRPCAMILEKGGLSCVSIRKPDRLSEAGRHARRCRGRDQTKPLDALKQDDLIRLTSLVDKTPVTIATNRDWTDKRASPFRRVTFGSSKVSVAEQFEYIVLQKA